MPKNNNKLTTEEYLEMITLSDRGGCELPSTVEPADYPTVLGFLGALTKQQADYARYVYLRAKQSGAPHAEQLREHGESVVADLKRVRMDARRERWV
jgi:hypothetical protein